jgi:hypothetical protein
MRWAAAIVAVLVAVGVTGCTSAHEVPTPAPSSVSPSAKLSADAAFEAPIVCRAVHDYDSVQTAITGGDLTALHRVAAAAAADDAAGFAQERAHMFVADIRSLQTAYFAKGAEQVQYYRDVAKANTILAAEDLQFPDGTAASTPVFAAIHFPIDYPCPS